LIILGFARSYEMFVIGLMLHSSAIAGYTGFKAVIWIELVGLDNLAKVTTVEALLAGTNDAVF